jgi:hypothetical protein
MYSLFNHFLNLKYQKNLFSAIPNPFVTSLKLLTVIVAFPEVLETKPLSW